MSAPAPLVIQVAEPGQRARALLYAYGYLGAGLKQNAAMEALRAINEGSMPGEGLAVALRSTDVVGGALLQLSAGHIASIHPPETDRGESPETSLALLRFLEQRAREQGAQLLQATAPARCEILEAAGLIHAAELLFLGASPRSCDPSVPWEWEQVTDDTELRLRGVVEASYVDSLDIPLLDGVRETSDVIEGYRATGTYRPEWWRLLRWRDRDVGCLVMADFPEEDRVELVYMGLAPEVRGQGWGCQLAAQALSLAAEAGRALLLLAVDAANTPALQAYQTLGFEPWGIRQAYMKKL